MGSYRAVALQPDAIARAVVYALSQPEDIDVNEIVVRPDKGRALMPRLPALRRSQPGMLTGKTALRR